MMKAMKSLVKVFTFAVLLHKAWQICNTSDLLCVAACVIRVIWGVLKFLPRTKQTGKTILLLQCTAALTLAAAHNLEYFDYLSITVMGIT